VNGLFGWLRPPVREDRSAGMTLVEMTVAMAVSSVLLASLGMVFASTLRTVTKLNNGNEQSRLLATAMQRVTDNIRSADPVTITGVTSAVLSPTATNQLTFVSDVYDPVLAATLSTQVNAADPGDDLAAWMTSTNLVQKKINYVYSTNACGGVPGIAQTITPPRYTGMSGGAPVFAWDTGPVTGCFLKTTTPPAFTYYQGSTVAGVHQSGCDPSTRSPFDGTLASVESVALTITQTGNNAGTTALQNQTCMVNVNTD
jgi:prepilin-type N-terminal cleavage/methylation domain-containing protein